MRCVNNLFHFNLKICDILKFWLMIIIIANVLNKHHIFKFWKIILKSCIQISMQFVNFLACKISENQTNYWAKYLFLSKTLVDTAQKIIYFVWFKETVFNLLFSSQCPNRNIWISSLTFEKKCTSETHRGSDALYITSFHELDGNIK